MEKIYRYRGQDYKESHFLFIQDLIDKNPDLSRRKLSVKLCEAWGWVQANGHLRDMVCRSLMLALHRERLIRLPEKKFTPNNPLQKRVKPVRPDVDETPFLIKLQKNPGATIELVRDKETEKIHNGLIEHHHYLGYTQPVGQQLKYIIYLNDRIVGAISFSSPPRHIGNRDRHIGWDKSRREKALHLLAYNTRFLILPWVRIPHLATHILGKVSRRISSDWRAIHGHPVHLLETFVDTERFAGTCYKAANWILVGQTTGRGKNDQTRKANRSIKNIWLYPLHKHWRRQMLNEEE
jgi:hypothetical protein